MPNSSHDEDREESVMHVSDNRIIQLIATVYGPYAFGVASLLIIWYTIVSPQLERQAVDFARSEKVVEAQREILQSMTTMVRAIEQTSTSIEKASLANERIAVSLENAVKVVERIK